MNSITKFLITFLIILCVFTSCRKEEIVSVNPPEEETLDPNSNIADLMLRTTSKDGSNDNILDYANCFAIKLPISVTANSVDILINSEQDYDLVETIFDEYIEDTDELSLSYPLTIVREDFSEVLINNYSELNDYKINCNGENIADDDIECIDFVYPITSSTFNTVNELIDRHTFTNDHEFFLFIESISSSDIISIDFPLSVTIYDGTEETVNSLDELETAIIDVQNVCDEDDDFDYNDDDCDHCTQELLANYLTGCTDWSVNKLRRDSINNDDLYEGYDFNFFIDGTISVFWSGITAYGTWEVTGTANNMNVIIDVPALPPCNNNWHLQEIDENDDDTQIDLRLSDANRLRYENPCN